MLYAKVLRTKYPSAKILNINLDEAEKIPGVKAIITAKDIPNNEFGVIIPDQQVLAKERTYFIGDGIALVAAETPETAKKAVESIKV